ncbi:hypothetical protein C8R43DRAFT_859799, partial [Mycena crocata]
MVSFQNWASNANVTDEPPLVTGGSWKKSPRENKQTWMPPKGRVDFLIRLPMRESLSKRSPSSIDTA